MVELDGDVLALRSLCNQNNIILPSRQPEVWAAVSRVLDKLSAAEKVVDALPKFADGVIATHGDKGWCPGEKEPGTFNAASTVVWGDDGDWYGGVRGCYSTREAAKAAERMSDGV